MEKTVHQRYAIVTGSNKGIGFETARQLALQGIKVVLTSRDEKKGLEAVEKLKASGLSDDKVVFHQLDVTDPAIIKTLMEKAVHQRYAIVTGSNKGIGFETVRQLASEGIKVVLTSRDEKKGLDAVEKLKASGLSDDKVVFHQLDVTDPASIASLVNFIKTQFGKLDILVLYIYIYIHIHTYINELLVNLVGYIMRKYLINGNLQVNNAGILGIIIDLHAYKSANKLDGVPPKADDVIRETFEATKECLDTNYYGAKRMVDAFVPLLQLSDSPRIVNISSSSGLLKNIPNEGVKQELKNVENLTEERIDELLNKLLKDFKEGLLDKEGWPAKKSGYILSKAFLNAYTRILAKKYPQFLVNCVCPGLVKTDITYNFGELTAAEGAQSPVRLALLPQGGPSGNFFSRHETMSCF
ncbi:hypothetical protein JRO89_XS08G0014500 [Xanthoceras sorbifolium]|uniref:Uncharacterized protein n=1 Tax=Xanthoceras sorbifolium TaxID=99658 RepID=A0ABQ8HN51_9ROSI|nr:hypothetical protein JRO89_XS08G0014500 [Xanthoceras sorbifolium]